MEKIFDLQKYRNENKKDTTSKLRCFFEYLEENFIENGYFDNEYLELLSEEHFLQSLKFYIERAKYIPARQSANDYIRDLKKFFGMLLEEYGIRNAVFYDYERLVNFDGLTKPIIENLREQENKECILDEEYEKLDEAINEFLSISNLKELISKDIEENYYKTNKNSKYYTKFLSVLPVKLAMKYALSNKTLVDLKISALDMQKKILSVHGFAIALDQEMVKLFQVYLEMRTQIIDLYRVETDILFLKVDGESCVSKSRKNIGQPEASTLFFIMSKAIGNTACKKVSYKRIIELVQKGADINALWNLSGVKPDKIRMLCGIDDNKTKQNLEKILSNEHEDIDHLPVITKKGVMKCNYCGKEKTANANEWIIIQVGKSEECYLACKECRGRDGKRRY